MCPPFIFKNSLQVHKLSGQVVLARPQLKGKNERLAHDVLGWEKSVLGGPVQNLKFHRLQMMSEITAFGYGVAIESIRAWSTLAQEATLTCRGGASRPVFSVSAKVENRLGDTSVSPKDHCRLGYMEGYSRMDLGSNVFPHQSSQVGAILFMGHEWRT